MDSIEQKANANFLLCSGLSIKNAIEATEGTLKENVVSKIKESMPDVVTDEIIKVTPFGKKNTHVRVECTSPGARRMLITRARQVKPVELYFSELLTPRRNTMFHSLRSLKSKFPNVIKAVYTRDGNIFYKLHGSDDFKKIKCPREITELEKRFSRTEE